MEHRNILMVTYWIKCMSRIKLFLMRAWAGCFRWLQRRLEVAIKYTITVQKVLGIKIYKRCYTLINQRRIDEAV